MEQSLAVALVHFAQKAYLHRRFPEIFMGLPFDGLYQPLCSSLIDCYGIEVTVIIIEISLSE